MQLPTPKDPSVCSCSYLIISALAVRLFSRFVFERNRKSKNVPSLVKRLSKLQPVAPSGSTRASWRCQSGARRNERNVPLLIWVTQAPSALTRLLGSRTRNPFSLARLNMKYRTGVEGGKAEERDGGLSGWSMCQGPMAGSVLPGQTDTSFHSFLYLLAIGKISTLDYLCIYVSINVYVCYWM